LAVFHGPRCIARYDAEVTRNRRPDPFQLGPVLAAVKAWPGSF